MSSASEGGVVRRNALWNIFGLGFPLALAVFFVPHLIRGAGTERFGALTLVWAFLGYFSLFDLGLGRALTQLLAENIDEDRKSEADLIWMSFAISTLLGLIAAMALFFLSPLLVSKVLRLQGSLAGEMLLSLRELAFVLPILIHSVMLKGILEAKRRFDLSNLIRIPLGVFTYAAPLAVLPFSHNLGAIVAVLLAGRVLAWTLNLWQVFRIVPHLKQRPVWRRHHRLKLMRFGGWVTLSYIVTPFTDNADRVLITSLLSISVLAYYTTPLELMGKLSIISLGIGGVIFPEFASRFRRDPEEAKTLYLRGAKYIVAVLFPLVLLATAYAHEGLAFWLNTKFADAGAVIVQWLAIAALVGGFRLIPYYFLVGAGKPNIPALYDLFELPLYAGILYVSLRLGGLRAAAIAALIRVAAGGLTYHWFSGRILKFQNPLHLKTLGPLVVSTGVLFAFHIPMVPLLKAALVLGALLLHGCAVWIFVLEKKDKLFVLKRLQLG